MFELKEIYEVQICLQTVSHIDTVMLLLSIVCASLFGMGVGSTGGRLHLARGTSFSPNDIWRRLYNLETQAYIFASSLGTVAGWVPITIVNESRS